jgi:M6 family metalloprotease-like protein
MTRRFARGRRPVAALVLLIPLLSAVSAGGGDVLLCKKGAQAPEELAARMESAPPKIFADELPRTSAVELAAARGRSRAGRTTVRLLALRVQFRPDSDARSTGDGTFDYSEWDGETFDGPPHDREYFSLHMTALANYFDSMSYGQLAIDFDVAPAASESAYVLPHDMGYYHDYSEGGVWYVSQVEAFTRDAFAAADTSDSIDFSQYDGYVIFHAGADWQSDINYDTPFDLPSAHIALGEPILVNEGANEVWGAAIMPETSSQDGMTYLLNGTLAHEVGHILGLPDLYNTYNFFPAIGVWGIMDSGGSLGMDTPWGWAYGVLPASTCAWSKEYMGWLEPVVVLDDAAGIEVKATEMRGPGERLFKIPITSDEYFLVENRLDDLPDSLGDTLVVGVDQERGVVLGPVDPYLEPPVRNHEYDFLLPGPGLLIYHIDDTRVEPGLMPWDTVNADRHRRGVAVEEADGIMDLGNIFSYYWSGSRYDPFFAENNDAFSWDTFPATDTNLGGKTYLSVSGISDPDTVMTMNVAFERWKDGWPKDLGEPLGRMSPRVADLDGDGDNEVIVATRTGAVHAWHHDGTPVIAASDPPGRFALAPGGISRSPSVADIDEDGDSEVIVASDAGSLYVWDHSDVDVDGSADIHAGSFPVAIGGAASSVPVAADLTDDFGLEMAVASRGGLLTLVDRAGSHLEASPYSFGYLILSDVTLAAGDLDGDAFCEVVMSTTNRGWVVAANPDGSPVTGWPVIVDSWEDDVVGVVVGDLDRAPDGAPEVIAAASSGEVRVWDRRGQLLTGWPVDLGGPIEARPSLGDLDGDGYLEVVVPAGRGALAGLRWNGSNAENWPLSLAPGDSAGAARASALLGEIDDEAGVDVLLAGTGGNTYVWDASSGDLAPGWPYSSDPAAGTPWAGDLEGDGWLDMVVAGSEGRVLVLNLPYAHAVGGMIWSTEGGSASGAGAYPDSLMPGHPVATAGLMSPERTYCYPNPAKESDLTVRVYLEEEADIEVEIMDVAGQVVARFVREGVLYVNEVVWPTSGVASGLYLVRATVSDSSVDVWSTPVTEARTESKTMKVAVIR